MKLRLKNKMIKTVEKLLSEAKIKGYIPRHIEMDMNEATALMKELYEHRHGKEIDTSRFKVVSKFSYTEGASKGHPLQWISSSFKETMELWKKDDYIVTHDDVEIKILNDANIPPEPTPPENTVIKDGHID